MATVNPIQVQKFLSGMDYPAKKDELVKHAKTKEADDKRMQTLAATGGKLSDAGGVSKAIGQIE